jgi:hypothetical protein
LFHQFQRQVFGQHVGLVEPKGRFALHETHWGGLVNPAPLAIR